MTYIKIHNFNDLSLYPFTKKQKGWNCLIRDLAKVRNGNSMIDNSDALGCAGAKRYLGYTETVRPGFEYFLSCGNDKITDELTLDFRLVGREHNSVTHSQFVPFSCLGLFAFI